MKFSKMAKVGLTLALGVLAGVAVAARTDVNTVPFSESFESNPEGLWDNGEASMAVTNGWYSGANDASYVTNDTYSLPSGVSSPISGTSTRYLRLNTEGDTLTNDVANGSFASSKLYLDTLVKFVVSEDIPVAVSNDANVKVAVFALAGAGSTNLVVYHGAYDLVGGDFGKPVFNTLSDEIDPSLWYRLTIVMDAYSDLNSAEAFKVMLNGVALTDALAYGDDWKTKFDNTAPAGGSWFLSAARRAGPDGSSLTEITSLGFQGTGSIDDLVLSATDPFAAPPTGETFIISQSVGANGSANPADASIEIDEGGSTSIVYTASEWYRIDELTVDTVAVPAAAGLASYQLDLDDVQDDVAVVVTFEPWSHPYGTIPLDWLDQFTEAEIAAGDADAFDLDTEYLLNTDPTADTTYSFEVTAITAGDDVQVTVKLIRDTVLGDINGQLKLYVTDDLDNAFTFLAGTAVDGDDFGTEGNEHTYTFIGVAEPNRFYKAVIE